MKAMVLRSIGPVGDTPLVLEDGPDPEPGTHDIRIRVSVCGVCHTELDEIEGRSAPPRLPVVPGHQIVGVVDRTGAEVKRFRQGDRAGVAWIAYACGRCHLCGHGQENLCAEFRATGRDCDGGYAEAVVIHEQFAHRIPDTLRDAAAAPLLCAGAIGLRSLRLTMLQPGQPLGLTGFGASAHLVLKMAAHLLPGSPVYVFTRSESEQMFARDLGASWAGGIGDRPPVPPDAIIDTTPAWAPVLASLQALAPAGRLVINAIRKENTDRHLLESLDYASHLWMEKEIKSVANVTRADVHHVLELATEMTLNPEVQEYPLADANLALRELRERRIRGAKVLRVGPGR